MYVASLQDTVFAIDAKTGAWKWHHRREPRPGFTIRGAAPVHVVGGDGVRRLLGRLRRRARPGDGRGPLGATWWRPRATSSTSTASSSTGDRVYAAAYSGAVVALDAATGATRWTFDAPGAVKLALAPGGTVVAVATAGVYALSTDRWDRALVVTARQGHPLGRAGDRG